MSDICISTDQNPKIIKKSISKQSPKKTCQKSKKCEKTQSDSSEKCEIIEDESNYIDKISFEICKDEYFDQMVDLLTEIFTTQEPICKSCSVSFEDLRQFIYKIAKVGINLSSVAVYKTKDENGKSINQVVSAMVSCDQKDLVMIENDLNQSNVPQIQHILNIFDLTISKCKEMTGVDLHNAKQGQVMHQVLIGTNQKFQKMGIGFAISLHNAYIGQKQGFQHAVMELTSKFSLNLCKLSNVGKIIFSIKYRQLQQQEQFKFGLSQMEESMLDEELSIYFVNAEDFIYTKYEKYTKDLQFIF